MEHQELIDRGTYPHSRKGTTLSIIIVAVFLASIPILVSRPQPNLLIELGFGILVVSGITAYVRILSFNRMKEELKEKKRHSSRPNRRVRALMFLGGLAFIFIPFFAVGFIDPLTWLASLGAVICGLNLGELALTYYVKLWINTNHLQLTRFEIWLEEEFGRGKLMESGVRAEVFTPPGNETN